MLVENIIKNVHILTGNLFNNYSEDKMLFFINTAIDEINLELKTEFQEVTSVSQNYEEFPDSLIRSVLCYGVAVKLFEEYDELDQQFASFKSKYDANIAKWRNSTNSMLTMSDHEDLSNTGFIVRGRVDTLDDLKQIHLPNILDAYLVGPDTPNNTRWELWVYERNGLWVKRLTVVGRTAYNGYLQD